MALWKLLLALAGACVHGLGVPTITPMPYVVQQMAFASEAVQKSSWDAHRSLIFPSISLAANQDLSAIKLHAPLKKTDYPLLSSQVDEETLNVDKFLSSLPLLREKLAGATPAAQPILSSRGAARGAKTCIRWIN
jgi:hypothetical protein